MIRAAGPEDFEGLWPIVQAVAAEGETYAYPRDLGKAEARRLWMDAPRRTFVAEEDGLVGSKELCKRLPVDKSKIVAMVAQASV